MRTYVYCREHDMQVFIGCAPCGQRVEMPAMEGDAARKPLGELHRSGALRCPTCGEPGLLSIMGLWWGRPREMECWTAAGAHVVPPDAPGAWA